MAKIVSCDRCGELYAIDPPTLSSNFPHMYSFGRNLVICHKTKINSDNAFDLCKKCQTELEDWYYKKELKNAFNKED